MYGNGDGVTRDYTQAAEWYRKAAASNDAEAKCSLAELLAQGQGVKKDLNEARRLAHEGLKAGGENCRSVIDANQLGR